MDDIEILQGTIKALSAGGRARELAARAGVSRSWVMRMASGQTGAPSYAIIQKVRAVVAQMLSESTPMPMPLGLSESIQAVRSAPGRAGSSGATPKATKKTRKRSG